MSRLTRDGTAEPVSRHNFIGTNGHREIFSLLCSDDQEKDWKPYPVDPYSCLYVMAIHTHSGPNMTGRLNLSRETQFTGACGQGNSHLPCSADHEQDWRPYPVDPYSAICDDHTYINIYILYAECEKQQLPQCSRERQRTYLGTEY